MPDNGKRPCGLEMEGFLNRENNASPTPVSHLRTTVIALDTPSIFLSSHSSQSLLLRTTITSSRKTINTLIDSGATDNFIDEAWATLAPGPPQRLPISICLRLFDRNASSVGDITHFVHLPITFANRQQQELQRLVTKLHASALLILGLPWLQSTNPWINWQSLTLHFNRDTTPPHFPVPFELPTSLPAPRDPGAPSKESPTHSSLRSNSGQSFIINTRLSDSLEILSALIDSKATETFISDRLALPYQDIDKPLEL
ncbi:hypothetical protein C0992_008361 [Termitomyces sp. T32_za158]|nr:hypothetical protein C0992_008361 [Termitomyces sp. T32_za158]